MSYVYLSKIRNKRIKLKFDYTLFNVCISFICLTIDDMGNINHFRPSIKGRGGLKFERNSLEIDI